MHEFNYMTYAHVIVLPSLVKKSDIRGDMPTALARRHAEKRAAEGGQTGKLRGRGIVSPPAVATSESDVTSTGESFTSP
jgi:hypothetical protein